MEALDELKEMCENNDGNIREIVQRLVRTYHPAEQAMCHAG